MKIISKKVKGNTEIYPQYAIGDKVYCYGGSGVIHTIDDTGFNLSVWWDNVSLNEEVCALEVSYMMDNGKLNTDFEFLYSGFYNNEDEKQKLEEKILDLYFNGGAQ